MIQIRTSQRLRANMWRIIRYLVIICFILFHSCEKERELVNYCTDMGRSEGPVPFTTFAEVSNDSINCFLTPTEHAYWFRPVFHVINDQHALDTMLECSSYDFDFNFEEYTLLIGYFYSGYGPAALSKQEVKLNCGMLEQYLMYTVTIDLEDNDGFKDTLIQHNVIVPKLPEELEVRHGVKKNRLYEIMEQ